jgi:hypothetical protein
MCNWRAVLVVGVWTALLAPSGSGQTVVAVGGATKELKRTAYQLRISVDRLRNAREALKQATDIARRSSDPSSVSQLSQLWMRIDRAQAPGAMEDLYSWMATAARGAEDDAAYQRLTSSAQSLLRSLVSIDAPRASELWQRWPDPPTPFGDALRKRQEEVNDRFAKQLAGQAPVGASPDLSSFREAAARGDFSSAGILISQLNQTGDRAEALRIADQGIQAFKRADPTGPVLSGYVNFVRQLSSVDPDRYMTAFGTMVSSLDRQANPKSGGTISIGDQTIQVTGSEAAAIDMCRSLMGRPDLAMKTLNSMPGLKAKLDLLGGIDNVVGIPRGGPASVNMKYSMDGSTFTTISNSAGGGMSIVGSVAGMVSGTPAAQGQDLYSTVRGKLAKDPAFVRQKLAEASKSPDQVDAILMLASRSATVEPDLATLALETVARLLPGVDPLQKRATIFQSLMRTYRNCDGEVDADVLQMGMSLVQQLRAEENANAPNSSSEQVRVGMAPRIASMADQLEMAILAELSLTNFDGAVRYLRLMPEEIRLQALLRILQSLVQM